MILSCDTCVSILSKRIVDIYTDSPFSCIRSIYIKSNINNFPGRQSIVFIRKIVVDIETNLHRLWGPRSGARAVLSLWRCEFRCIAPGGGVTMSVLSLSVATWRFFNSVQSLANWIFRYIWTSTRVIILSSATELAREWPTLTVLLNSTNLITSRTKKKKKKMLYIIL